MRFPAVLALIAFVSPAFAQFTPPLGARHEVAGPRTEMLTLGSVHLSGHPDWQRGWLEPLIDRLAAWRPRVITVEQISGTQCEGLHANPSLYGDAFDTYCGDATPFQASLRMSQAQVMTQALRTLASWPDAPSAPQRRQLAMLFLAADDPASAQMQWLRLPPAERHAGDGVTDAAVKVLAREGNRMNETYEIAAALAARLGLDRVYPVDDRTSDAIDLVADPAFGPWQMARYKAIDASGVGAGVKQAEAAVHDADTLLGLYRRMNAAGAMDAQVQADFGGGLSDPHEARFGRQYVGWWETRNLRMPANIREAVATTPGVRVLNVVGASHKPWYDQWARQMGDVDAVPAASGLGP